MAAAGLWTTASDLAVLGCAVLRGLRGERTALGLRPDALAAMVKPQLKGQSVGTAFCGLGWFCNGKDEGFQFGHDGHDEGFLASLRLYPMLGKGAVTMFNSIQGWRLRRELYDAIGREHGWPAEPASPDPADATGTDAGAGRYRTASGMEFRIEPSVGQLILRFEDQPPLALTRSPDGSFATPLLRQRVRFVRSASGKATMTITQSGTTIRAEHQPE
jgi:hypothetical protein